MQYNIEIDDIFDLKNKSYLTIDTTTTDNFKYLFVCEVENEQPTAKFSILKCLPEGIVEEKDESILKGLLSVFNSNINDKLSKVSEVTE